MVTKNSKPEDLAKLSERELSMLNRLTDAEQRHTMTCSLIQHRLPDALSVGDQVPDLSLLELGQRRHVRLRQHIGDRPLLLAFGSYT